MKLLSKQKSKNHIHVSLSLKSWVALVAIIAITLLGVHLLSTSHADSNGYHIEGNTIKDANGKVFVSHGVDRPTLEWGCGGNDVGGGGSSIPDSDFSTMHNSWSANTVRIALNQDFWLPGASRYCSSYQNTVDHALQTARNAGMVVILDLHWSDQGNLANTSPGQQCMADQNSITFWQQVASKYKTDTGVWFELYNEPENISWSIWQNGGNTCGFNAVGMQKLADTIRATGASNIVLAGGINYATHLDGMPRLSGSNIGYATHPYADQSNANSWSVGDWDNRFGYVGATAPVIATEFGKSVCGTSTYDQGILDYFRSHGIGYTGWAWFSGGCNFPSLISDAAGTCAQGGCAVQADMKAIASGAKLVNIPGLGSVPPDDALPPNYTPSLSVSLSASPTTAAAGAPVVTTATGSIAIAKVEFYVDGALKSTISTAPFNYTWPTGGVSGVHNLQAKAYNAVGTSASSNTVSVTITAAASPVAIPFRINAGGSAYVDSSGTAWQADAYASSGSTDSQGTGQSIKNTTNQLMYQSEHYGMSSYTIPVANGTYTVKLHFAELYSGCATVGCRVFSVTANGQPVISNLDIFKEVGLYTADDKQISVTVTNGTLSLGFSPSMNQAQITGLEILPFTTTNPSPTPTPPPASGCKAVPSTPGTPQLTGTTASTISMKWTASTPVSPCTIANYHIYRNDQKVADLIGTVINFTDQGLNAATTYAYKITATDSSGNISSANPSLTATTVGSTVNSSGDVNNDRRVNALDLSILVSHDGQNYAPADLNHDGTVGAADLAIMLAHWTW